MKKHVFHVYELELCSKLVIDILKKCSDKYIMIYGNSDYGKVSPIIQSQLGEYHQHTAKKSDSVWQTFKHDHDVFIVEITKNALKGAALGLLAGFASYQFKNADKRLLTDRLYSSQIWRKYFYNRLKPNMVIGALGGVAWYFLYDQILCQHGDVTLTKHVLAYTIAGSAAAICFSNPGNFFYGAIFGSLIGLFSDFKKQKVMPCGVEIQMGKYDPIARAKAIHDERQLALSRQLIRGSRSLLENSYVV